MQAHVSPYLNFNGHCREALTLYHSCFGGKLMFQSPSDFPGEGGCPDMQQPSADAVMHGQLENRDFMIMGTDMNGPEGFQPGNDFAFGVSLDSEESLRRCVEILGDRGTVVQQIEPTPWADLFAVVIDRFGKRWYLNYFGNQQPQ